MLLLEKVRSPPSPPSLLLSPYQFVEERFKVSDLYLFRRATWIAHYSWFVFHQPLVPFSSQRFWEQQQFFLWLVRIVRPESHIELLWHLLEEKDLGWHYRSQRCFLKHPFCNLSLELPSHHFYITCLLETSRSPSCSPTFQSLDTAAHLSFLKWQRA